MKHILFGIFVFTSLAGFVFAADALASSKDDIVFPVTELAGCESEEACKAYCDNSANAAACFAFAEKHNLLDAAELERAKKFQELGIGPGGCTTEGECESYCNNMSNITECLAFAEQHGFMDGQELAEAKKVAQLLQQGATLPGGCMSKEACESYCEDTSHMKECIEFGERAGFIQAEELQEAKQVLKALEAGVRMPGGCTNKRSCETYCNDTDHMEECFAFAKAAGFMSEEEAMEAERVLPLMARGETPGGCRSRQACESYCADESHQEECMNFAVKAGFMSEEELANFKKTGGKGPGGCVGKACEDFCNNPTNQETCFAFAKEHNLISEEELQKIQQGTESLRAGIEGAPAEVAQCLRERIGQDVLNKIQEGTFLPNPQLGEAMRECFELQRQAIESKMRECLSKSCDEFFACLDSIQQAGLQGGGRTEGEHPRGEEGGGFSVVQQEIESKIGSCVQQFQPQEGQGFPGGDEFPGGFPGESGFPQRFEEDSLSPEFQGKSREEIEQIFRDREEQRVRQEFEQEFERQTQEQHNTQPFIFENDNRAAACTEEGGVWDGTGCRAQEGSQRIFPEGKLQHDESFQFQQEQIQRQEQQQQIEQELQQQFQQLEQLQQQLQSTPTEAPAGGNVLDAIGSLLNRLLRR